MRKKPSSKGAKVIALPVKPKAEPTTSRQRRTERDPFAAEVAALGVRLRADGDGRSAAVLTWLAVTMDELPRGDWDPIRGNGLGGLFVALSKYVGEAREHPGPKSTAMAEVLYALGAESRGGTLMGDGIAQAAARLRFATRRIPTQWYQSTIENTAPERAEIASALVRRSDELLALAEQALHGSSTDLDRAREISCGLPVFRWRRRGKRATFEALVFLDAVDAAVHNANGGMRFRWTRAEVGPGGAVVQRLMDPLPAVEVARAVMMPDYSAIASKLTPELVAQAMSAWGDESMRDETPNPKRKRDAKARDWDGLLACMRALGMSPPAGESLRVEWQRIKSARATKL